MKNNSLEMLDLMPANEAKEFAEKNQIKIIEKRITNSIGLGTTQCFLPFSISDNLVKQLNENGYSVDNLDSLHSSISWKSKDSSVITNQENDPEKTIEETE